MSQTAKDTPVDTTTIKPLKLQDYSAYFLQGCAVEKEWIVITPELAAQWLERNLRNRPVYRSDVKKHVRSIRRGAFYLTGDPIRFDEEGILMDGQHRLLAIVEAGMPAASLVVNNLPPGVSLVIDSNLRRTNGQALTMRGFFADLADTSAAAIKVIKGLEAGRVKSVVDREDVIEIGDKYRDELQAEARKAQAVPARLSRGNVTAIAFILRNFLDKGDLADEYINIMVDGATPRKNAEGVIERVMASPSHPVKRCREWNMKHAKAPPHINANLRATLHAVNLCVEGKKSTGPVLPKSIDIAISGFDPETL